jgi:hypothetical protein
LQAESYTKKGGGKAASLKAQWRRDFAGFKMCLRHEDNFLQIHVAFIAMI